MKVAVTVDDNLIQSEKPESRQLERRIPTLKLESFAMGVVPELNYDSVEDLMELAEGPLHR